MRNSFLELDYRGINRNVVPIALRSHFLSLFDSQPNLAEAFNHAPVNSVKFDIALD